jgi:polysaccharide transporter, PST family
MLDKLTAIVHNSSPKLKKILSSIVWLFFDRVLAIGASFFISVLVARYLGPERLGTFKYVTAFVFLFSPLSTFGMNSIVIRELVEEPFAKNELMGTAFFLRLICGLLSSLLTILAILLLPTEQSNVQLMVSIASSIFLFKSFTVIEDWFQSQVESKYPVLARNITLFILSVLKIVFVHYQAPLILFVCLPILEAAFYSLILIWFYSKNNSYKRIMNWTVNRARAIFLLKESFPLLLNGIAVGIFLSIDQVMLGQMVGKSAVGTYSIAVNLSEMWYMIPVIFSSSLYPSVIQLKHQDKALYEKRMQRYYDLMALLAYGVILCFLPFSRILIISLYGVEYLESVSILYIHILTCPFNFIGIAQSTWLISEGLQKFNFYASFLGAILNIALNAVLIPKFAGIGAAIATLISYAGASYFFFLLFPETRKNAFLATKSIFFPLRILQIALRK